MVRQQDVGIVGGVNVGLPILMTMSAFLAIALYNVIELTFLVFARFKKWSGMYFWSLVVSTWGIAIHAIGYIGKFFRVITIRVLASSIIAIGWTMMVTGQSLVLYSRLHLVVQDARKIRWVLYMIIVNAIIMGCPIIVLALGSAATRSPHFIRPFVLYDKIQLVVFSVQETIISAIYIYQTVRFLGRSRKHGDKHDQKRLRKLLAHLILVNIIVVIFDITLLAIQFSGHFEIQTTYKTAVYSIKLKLEFSVLNRLAQFVTDKRAADRSFHLDTWASNKQVGPNPPSDGYASFGKIEDAGKTDSIEAKSSNAGSKVTTEEIDTIPEMYKRNTTSV